VFSRRFGVPLVDLGTIRLPRIVARSIAAFPQTGLRNDRLSALEQWDLTGDAAIANELRRGRATIASGETRGGAERFAGGAGRHGAGTGRGTG